MDSTYFAAATRRAASPDGWPQIAGSLSVFLSMLRKHEGILTRCSVVRAHLTLRYKLVQDGLTVSYLLMPTLEKSG